MTLRPEQGNNELFRRQKDEKLRFFVPNGRQSEFIGLVGEGKHFIYILSAGNGIGKTALAINILGNIFWPGINFGCAEKGSLDKRPAGSWFQGTLFDSWPYPKRARIVTEAKNNDETGAIDQEIKHWWPKGRYRGIKGGKQYVSLYEIDNGWVMDKMSYEQEPKEFESSTLGLAIFDEPPPKPIFDATVARMRMGGIIIIPMTPIAESAQAQRDVSWIYEDLVDSKDKDTVILYGDSEDACKQHGVRGHLEHEHLERMWSKFSKDQLLARKSGRPMHFSNSIFGGSFDRQVHVIPDDTLPPPGSQFGMTTDPADGKPYALAWWWVDPRGHVVFDYEWPEDDWIKLVKSHPNLPDMKEYLPIFRKYEAGRHMEHRIMDRHFGNNRSVRTNRTLQEDWAEPPYNINFSLSYNMDNEVQTGILKVLEYLKYDKTKPLNGMNLPRVYAKERCKNIIKSLEKWSRKIDPNTFVAAPDPKSPYKDFCDVVRYTLMSNPEVYVRRSFAPKSQGYVLGR